MSLSLPYPSDSVFAMTDSPTGNLCLVASRAGLHALEWGDAEVARRLLRAYVEDAEHPVLKMAIAQLREYFAGEREQFDLPLAPLGTEFQKRVWLELRKIPYGATISYGEQARRLGDPKKARAVGTANSRNPLAIIVPCHRVIASSGALSGFGGGVERKKLLLDLEAQP